MDAGEGKLKSTLRRNSSRIMQTYRVVIVGMGKRGLHHGTANALCLAAVMAFNARRQPGLYRRVGLACGLDVVACRAGDADDRC